MLGLLLVSLRSLAVTEQRSGRAVRRLADLASPRSDEYSEEQ